MKKKCCVKKISGFSVNRLLLSVFVLCFVLTGFSGCMKKGKEDAETLENGVLKVGMNLNIDSMCYLSEKSSKPEGFEVEIARELADKTGLKLEIIDTSEKNLLKSLDGEIYDCVISPVGIADWNEHHYSRTKAYADIASVKEQIKLDTQYTRIAVFTKKNNPMAQVLDEHLDQMKKDGTLKAISKKYFEKDITIKE